MEVVDKEWLVVYKKIQSARRVGGAYIPENLLLKRVVDLAPNEVR